MRKIGETAIPVRTRVPLAAWAVAGLVTLFSLMSSALHLSPVALNEATGIEHATKSPDRPENGLDNKVMAALR